MKAVIYTKYGSPEVLKVTEIEKPTPKKNEVLIKIHAATVTSGDTRLRSSDFPPAFWLIARLIFGLFSPKKKILGHELSGVVEAVGSEVTKFNVGDEVFGTTTMRKTGSYAEYICLPAQWKSGVLVLKPKNLTHYQAAALPVGSMTALFLLEKAKATKGQSIVIHGASGSVGSYAVQIAREFRLHVTGICSTANVDMVRSLGAATVIDYTKEEYTQLTETFDIVFDAVGKIPKSKAKQLLKKDGTLVSIKMITSEKEENLLKIKDLAEQEKLLPWIDKTYALKDIVAAHTYVDTGRKKGNVVIEIKT
ncbi:MAG: NAD(P)-dependent alcohol dehydrogenase [Bacteroidota bacterium]